MKPPLILLVVLFQMIIALCSFSQSRFQTDKDQKHLNEQIAQLRDVCVRLNLTDSSETLLKNAMELETLSRKASDFDNLLYSYVIIGQHSLALNKYDTSLTYIQKGLDLALELENIWGITISYNTLAIWTINKENNYEKGFNYFLDGIRVAEKAQNSHLYAILSCNLALACELRNDTAGLSYAKSAYEYGVANNDKYINFAGAYTYASLMHLKGQDNQALEIIQEAETFLDDFSYSRTGTYTIHANILAALNRDKEAEYYYNKALEHISNVNSTTAINAYLSYGQFLIEHQRLLKAVNILKKGIDMSSDTRNPVHRYQLYLQLSKAYKLLNEPEDALLYYEAYHYEADSVFNVERERAVNDMRIKYETEKHERVVQEQKARLLLQQRRLYIVFSIVVILIICLGATYVLYRHKNRLYLLIVRQYKEMLQKEESTKDKYSTSMTCEKEQLLFDHLESLMKNEKMYKTQGLTKKQLADALGTNSAYLSQAVNARTGTSIVNYINKYRIDESIRLLSDASNTTPIKAIALDVGFNSISVFYRTFSEQVGMSPAKYRQKVLELSEKNN